VNEPMPPVDAEVLELLRDASPAPEEARVRVRGRLLDAVAAMGGHKVGGTDKGGANGVSLAGKKGSAIAFLVGGIVGGALHAAWTKPPPQRVVYVDRPASLPTAPANSTIPLHAESTEALSAAPTAIPSPSSPVPPSRASQLTAERVILEEARKALAQGDSPRALDRLERHRRTFANPLLAEERDAMWIQALVKTGRYDEARSRGEAFRKRSPDSLFSSSVESALESIP
jgi:hypothetical protein